MLIAPFAVAHATRSEIRNGQFYVDGEPFYVVAVGYNTLRPHQQPGVSYALTNYHWTEKDFERIKAAHFNTIRTWDALTADELALAKKYGLMVLQGIWLDPHQDFSDLHNQDAAVAIVQQVAEASKDADNILGYEVMTEPSVEAVLGAGTDETLRYFRRLKRTIQAVDPRPVSMDSWLPVGFLDHDIWDFVMFNTFAFTPASINYALGFPGYNRWLVDRFAPDRPFIVGETGGYAVSKSSTSPYGGYGGLNEYDQSLKDIESLRGTLEGHASGAVLVSWIDAWYYPQNTGKHEDEPWSWDGLLGIPTDSKKDMEGIPRQVYRDITVYNQALMIEPKANHLYKPGETYPINVYAAENVGGVDYTVNDGEWHALRGSGHGGWQGFFQLPKTAKRRQRFMMRATNAIGEELVRKEITVIAGAEPERVSIGLLDVSKRSGVLECRLKVTDPKHQPIPKRKVYFGFFFPAGWREGQGLVTTDANGEALIDCPILPHNADRFVYVAAGTDSPDSVRTGDMRLFKLGR